jgi:RND family efflux transporter MFP subunit
MSRPFPARRTAAALLLLLAACGRGGADPGASAGGGVSIGPENVVVVARATLSSGPTVSGELVADRAATVRAETQAAVVAIVHDEGDRVAAGTVLARLDDTALRDAMLSARSGVTAAQAAATLAQRNYERSQRLLAAGAIADRDLEAAKSAFDAAQAQLDDARARLTAAQLQLDKTQVKAPFAGVVSQRAVAAGDVVSPGAALFTVVDPGSMRLEATVPADQLGAVAPGMPVTFRVNGYGERTFTGRLTRINPTADPQTRQVRVYAAIPNAAGGLVAGLFAEGRVASATRDALTAPLTAVDQRGLAPTVLRLAGGKVERVTVEVGVRDDERGVIELLAGVAAGDTLLTGAAQGITPGTAVTVSRPADQAAAPRTN